MIVLLILLLLSIPGVALASTPIQISGMDMVGHATTDDHLEFIESGTAAASTAIVPTNTAGEVHDATNGGSNTSPWSLKITAANTETAYIEPCHPTCDSGPRVGLPCRPDNLSGTSTSLDCDTGWCTGCENSAFPIDPVVDGFNVAVGWSWNVDTPPGSGDSRLVFEFRQDDDADGIEGIDGTCSTASTTACIFDSDCPATETCVMGTDSPGCRLYLKGDRTLELRYGASNQLIDSTTLAMEKFACDTNTEVGCTADADCEASTVCSTTERFFGGIEMSQQTVTPSVVCTVYLGDKKILGGSLITPSETPFPVDSWRYGFLDTTGVAGTATMFADDFVTTIGIDSTSGVARAGFGWIETLVPNQNGSVNDWSVNTCGTTSQYDCMDDYTVETDNLLNGGGNAPDPDVLSKSVVNKEQDFLLFNELPTITVQNVTIFAVETVLSTQHKTTGKADNRVYSIETQVCLDANDIPSAGSCIGTVSGDVQISRSTVANDYMLGGHQTLTSAPGGGAWLLKQLEGIGVSLRVRPGTTRSVRLSSLVVYARIQKPSAVLPITLLDHNKGPDDGIVTIAFVGDSTAIGTSSFACVGGTQDGDPCSQVDFCSFSENHDQPAGGCNGDDSRCVTCKKRRDEVGGVGYPCDLAAGVLCDDATNLCTGPQIPNSGYSNSCSANANVPCDVDADCQANLGGCDTIATCDESCPGGTCPSTGFFGWGPFAATLVGADTTYSCGIGGETSSRMRETRFPTIMDGGCPQQGGGGIITGGLHCTCSVDADCQTTSGGVCGGGTGYKICTASDNPKMLNCTGVKQCTCATDADCGTNGVCTGGFCTKGNFLRINCTSDANCATSQTCRHQVCGTFDCVFPRPDYFVALEGINNFYAKSPFFDLGIDDTPNCTGAYAPRDACKCPSVTNCSVDADCPGTGARCIGVQGSASGDECTESSNLLNTRIKSSASGVICSLDRLACSQDSECTIGAVDCSVQATACTCNVNADCGTAGACTDIQAGSKFFGLCTAGSGLHVGCSADTDCNSGFSCIVDPIDIQGKQGFCNCLTDFDCNQGYEALLKCTTEPDCPQTPSDTCVGGFCTTLGCNADSQCASAIAGVKAADCVHECSGGTDDGATCAVASDCASGICLGRCRAHASTYKCVNSICKRACDGTDTCVSSFCVNKTYGSCSVDTDCSSNMGGVANGEVCNGAACKVPCTANADCTGWECDPTLGGVCDATAGVCKGVCTCPSSTRTCTTDSDCVSSITVTDSQDPAPQITIHGNCVGSVCECTGQPKSFSSEPCRDEFADLLDYRTHQGAYDDWLRIKAIVDGYQETDGRPIAIFATTPDTRKPTDTVGSLFQCLKSKFPVDTGEHRCPVGDVFLQLRSQQAMRNGHDDLPYVIDTRAVAAQMPDRDFLRDVVHFKPPGAALVGGEVGEYMQALNTCSICRASLCSCSTNADCDPGGTCAGGICTASTDAHKLSCQADRQCASGQTCQYTGENCVSEGFGIDQRPQKYCRGTNGKFKTRLCEDATICPAVTDTCEIRPCVGLCVGGVCTDDFGTLQTCTVDDDCCSFQGTEDAVCNAE